MKIGCLLSLLLLAVASAASAAPWDDTVNAANVEGEVDVHGGPGRLYSEVLTEGFEHLYPRIKVNFSGSSGRDAIPQITRERAAGQYRWDVYVGGTPSILQALMPAGAFVPLRPALMLSEVLDDKAWYGGLDYEWMDKAKTYVLGFEAVVSPAILVNWDYVRHDNLKTFDDLLRPEFAGKIVWDDPRLPGSGVGSAQRFLINMGADFLKRLYTSQKIVYTTNLRQGAEWIVRGTYPIGIGAAQEQLIPFQEQGLGKNIGPFDAPQEHLAVSSGFGTVSMMDHAPHPNAAKVYINWLLAKAAQTDWAKTGHNSRRLDVPHPLPDEFPKAGATYFLDQDEAHIPSRDEAAALARQFIPVQP